VEDRTHGQTSNYMHASRLDGMQLRLLLSLFSIFINTRNQKYSKVHDKIPHNTQQTISGILKR